MDKALRALQGRLLKVFTWATVAIVLGAVVVFVTFVFCQDLRVVTSATGTVINVMWLGEYQANVRRIQLTELGTGTVIWELRGLSGRSFPMWQVPIHGGENPAIPRV